MLSYVFIAASALHPSMVRLTDRPADREVQLTRPRLMMLLGAVLFVPALLILDAVSGNGSNVPVMAGGSVVLTVLVLARLAGLVRAKDRKALRERVLREAGSALVTATTTEQIHQGALVALLALIGPGGSTRVSIASGSSETLTVLAADGAAAGAAVGTQVSVAALPTDARNEFLSGRTAVLDGEAPIDVPASAVKEEGRVVIVPLSTRSELRGGVFITANRALDIEALQSVETLAKQVALALESAGLAEEVHQRRHERRFRALVENSFNLIMVVTAEGATSFVSSTSMQMLGVPESEMTGMDAFERMHSDDRQRARTCSIGPDPSLGLRSPWRPGTATQAGNGVGSRSLRQPRRRARGGRHRAPRQGCHGPQGGPAAHGGERGTLPILGATRQRCGDRPGRRPDDDLRQPFRGPSPRSRSR
jgi:PAS domain-containing protein